MEHTPTATDHILAAFIEPGALPDIAKRLNMSLAALANWASAHADLLTNLHQLLTTRCKLIAAHLELAALSALATVSNAAASSTDDRLRERALERQRKAANAILRHKTSLERAPRASVRPHAPPKETTTPPSQAHLDAANTNCPVASAAISSPKPTLAQRLASRKLASLTLSQRKTPEPAPGGLSFAR